jgi:biotin transport system substrate-specific component
MATSATQVVGTQSRGVYWIQQAALVVGASLFVATCAHITLPLPFTPVPLTLQNFAVLVVGLTLGSRRGFAALALYLAEGASGLPVFNPSVGASGLVQLLGPTAGYLWAYPVVAGLAGWIMERGKRTFARAAVGSILGEIVLFAGGVGWLYVLTHSLAQAASFGLYPFIFAEVIKVMLAAGVASGWQRVRGARQSR